MSNEWVTVTEWDVGMPAGLHRNEQIAYDLGDGETRVEAAGALHWCSGEGRILRYRRLGVGDINGTTAGSAARFNTGKPPMELIPADILARYGIFGRLAAVPQPWDALVWWGKFQMSQHDHDALFMALAYLDHDGLLMEDCARAFDYGRKKYAAWNWARGQAWSVPIGSGIRHLLAMARGEGNDPESGLPHRGHVACNAVMLLWFVEHYKDGDDRFAPVVSV